MDDVAFVSPSTPTASVSALVILAIIGLAAGEDGKILQLRMKRAGYYNI
jgi:hypothetical protein